MFLNSWEQELHGECVHSLCPGRSITLLSENMAVRTDIHKDVPILHTDTMSMVNSNSLGAREACRSILLPSPVEPGLASAMVPALHDPECEFPFDGAW